MKKIAQSPSNVEHVLMYTFEVKLIYKIIHDHSNYERHQWTIFGFDKDIVQKELKIFIRVIPWEWIFP